MNAIVPAFKSLLVVAAAAVVFTAQADLVIPGADGTDGAYAPAANQTIDLSQAPTAPWDSVGAGKGVYDSTQWAVVFNYSPGGALWYRSGSYATAGFRNDFPLYGNARILPLIGGSGGGGYYDQSYGAGAGGGAILIAAAGTITVNGKILADGGGPWGWGGSGSGGAIRLVSDTLTGSGALSASGPGNHDSVDGGGEGRIRLETLAVNGTIRPSPATDVVAPDDPVILWPPATVPSARVVSVQTVSVPADPHSRFELGQVDVSLPNLATAQVLVETRNIDPAGTVRVRVSPKHSQPAFFNATFTSGDASQSTWTATATIPQGYCAIQAFAENPAP